jgi:hypothetical protein
MTNRLLRAYGGPKECRRALAGQGPARLALDEVTISGEVAEVLATAPAGRPYRLRLFLRDGGWAIDAVSAGPPG